MRKKFIYGLLPLVTLLMSGCDLFGETSSLDKLSSSPIISSSSEISNSVTNSESSSINKDELKRNISDIYLAENPWDNVKVEGVVIAINNAGFILYDGTGKIFFYTKETPNVKIGDNVEVNGPTVLYGASSKTHEIARKYKTHQFSYESAKYQVVETNYNIPQWSESPLTWIGANVDSYYGDTGTYIEIEAYVYKSGNYYNCLPLGTSMYSRILSLAYPLEEFLVNVDFSKANSEQAAVKVKITGIVLYLSSSFTNTDSPKYLNILVNKPLELVQDNNDDNDDNKGEKKEIDLYAINDFHGRISENINEVEPGIAKMSSYINEKRSKNSDGFVLLNSGDYWQDTYESGTNKGALLTECLDELQFDAFTLGNHEFDWGINKIEENKELTNVPFLGANIYEYPDTTKKSSLVDPYKIIERDGLKIGIVGAIGRQQITSITSRNWENLTFKDHVDVVQEVSDELRVDQGCDLVVLSFHGSFDDVNASAMSRVSPISNEKYFDAVFLGHSHRRENETINGVPFVQAGDHGCNLGYIKLEYQDGEVRALASGYEGYGLMNGYPEDQEVKAIVDKYLNEEYYTSKDEVIGTIKGASSLYSLEMGNILAKATYDILDKQGIDVDIVINNGARNSGNSGEMTREKIFNIIPFTNETIVVENISGQDIYNECVRYTNNYYKKDPNMKLDLNAYYTVACIDYMMLHKDANRNYNYFPSYSIENEIYTIKDYCYEIVCDYLLEHQTIDTNDYLGSHYSGL